MRYICLHVKQQSPSSNLQLIYSINCYPLVLQSSWLECSGWQKRIQWWESHFPSIETKGQSYKWTLLKSQQPLEPPQNSNFLYCIVYCHIFYYSIFFNHNPKHSNACVTYIQQRKVFSKVMDIWQEHMPEGECSSQGLWRTDGQQCPESLDHMLSGPQALKRLLLSSGLGFAIVEPHRPPMQTSELLLARN